MEHLPVDAIKLLTSFLTGHDAFHLSHTRSWWFKYVEDGAFWQQRLRSTQSWTKRFMIAPSLLFQGRQVGNNRQMDSFAYLMDTAQQEQPHHFRLSSLSDESFSFDVWFSLLPASDGHLCFGGVIYGLQSAERDSRSWPHYHQPIVVVNVTGDLYCSVLDTKPVVATNLQPNRWYHVVLSYDHDLQCQNVYLNGEIVRSDTGSLHEEWRNWTHGQVGTGCVTGGDERFPYRGHLGWYGFNGVIDEFRVWGGVLGPVEALELYHGGSLPNNQLRGAVKLARPPLMRPDQRWVNVRLISCSRPTESEMVELFELG